MAPTAPSGTITVLRLMPGCQIYNQI